jgi:protein-disulfide isomerase
MSKSSTNQKRALERAAQEKRNRQIGILVGIGALALIVAVVLILISIPKTTQVGAGDYSEVSQETVAVGQTKGFALGDADAPVTLIEYADFSCPHCYNVSPAIHQLIDEYVRNGRLRIIYVPVTFVNPPTSIPAAKAMICAAEQGKAWQMHDEIWSRYVSPGPTSYRETILVSIAEDSLGLDRAEFTACFDSDATAAEIENELFESRARGVDSTPSLFLNDERITYATEEQAYETLSEKIQEMLSAQSE